VQVTDSNPRADSGPVMPVQVVVVPEMVRQAAASVSCSVPVVVVLSTYEPSDFRVTEPVT